LIDDVKKHVKEWKSAVALTRKRDRP